MQSKVLLALRRWGWRLELHVQQNPCTWPSVRAKVQGNFLPHTLRRNHLREIVAKLRSIACVALTGIEVSVCVVASTATEEICIGAAS